MTTTSQSNQTAPNQPPSASAFPFIDSLKRFFYSIPMVKKNLSTITLKPNLISFTVFALILFTLIFFWNRMVVVVRSGEVGVLFSTLFGGTLVDYICPEGLHIIPPWSSMTIYNTRLQSLAHEFDVLTNLGLPIHLKITIHYAPEYEMIGLLHQRLGPNYAEAVIIPLVESVLRKNMGHYNPEDIYINKEGFLEKIILLALEEAQQKFVTIDDIIINSVTLPPAVKMAIEEKLVREQEYKAYMFLLLKEEQEAKRKRIEAEGIRDYQEIIAESLDDKMVTWQQNKHLAELANSVNAKVIVIGTENAKELSSHLIQHAN